MATFLYWNAVVMLNDGRWVRRIVQAASEEAVVETVMSSGEDPDGDVWKVLVEGRHQHHAESATLVRTYRGDGGRAVVVRCDCGARARLFPEQHDFGPPDDDDAQDMPAFPMEEPKWVVNSKGELGVEVGGCYFFLYKGGSLEYTEPEDQKSEGVLLVRPVEKREFGEVCRSPQYVNTALPFMAGEGWKQVFPGTK